MRPCGYKGIYLITLSHKPAGCVLFLVWVELLSHLERAHSSASTIRDVPLNSIVLCSVLCEAWIGGYNGMTLSVAACWLQLQHVIYTFTPSVQTLQWSFETCWETFISLKYHESWNSSLFTRWKDGGRSGSLCELSTLSSHASALLYCVALLVKYLICESYLASIPMEKHAGCLKIHSGSAAMQERRPSTEDWSCPGDWHGANRRDGGWGNRRGKRRSGWKEGDGGRSW